MISLWYAGIYSLIFWIVLAKTVGSTSMPSYARITIYPLALCLFFLDLKFTFSFSLLLKPVPYFIVSLPFVYYILRFDLKQSIKAVFIAEGIMIIFKLLFALSFAL